MLLGVDVGGTFTDAVLVDGDSSVHVAKVPTTPSDESTGVMAAIREVLEAAGASAGGVERFAHGMTVATNALLQGRTARTALIATEGFTDVIELGRQARPHLYRLQDRAPEPLVPEELRFGAPERIGPHGRLRELTPAAAAQLVGRVAAARPESVAVSLLHSYADPAHERLLAALLAEYAPELHVSLSSELVGTFREFERTATTVIDAALSPALAGYIARLADEARRSGLPEPRIMQSSGGLTDPATAGAHAALTVLSGPAGGVGGALLLARLAGEQNAVCFDMGGTSCDVCVIEDAAVEETADREIAGRPLSLPALDIHTVGAGGGSIAWRDAGGALRVGPHSAGAVPGPACYGRGGRLPTVTDANLLLGRLLSDAPLASGLHLDAAAAERAVGTLALELGMELERCALGIVRVAESQMLGALRLMTVERGIDPRDFALLPFGGAGALHAAAMAQELGITRILAPRAAGVLSALGLAAAAPRRDVSRTVMLAGPDLRDETLAPARAALAGQACAALGVEAARVRVRHELRYAGQSFELAVDEERGAGGMGADELREAFAAVHERRYGYRGDGAAVELVNMRASAWGPQAELRPRARRGAPPLLQERTIVFEQGPLTARVLRGEPVPGEAVDGPALWASEHSTLLVPPGWSAGVDEHGSVQMWGGADD